MTCNALSISSSRNALSRFTDSFTVVSGRVWACAEEKAFNKAALNSPSLRANRFDKKINDQLTAKNEVSWRFKKEQKHTEMSFV